MPTADIGAVHDRWITFRGQFGVPLLFGAAVLAGALIAFAFTGAGGGSPATPAAAGPVSTQAAPPPATTQSQPPTTAPAKPAKRAKGKANSGPRYLCIYPGVGTRHIISPLPGGVSRARWAMTCQATDGKPVTRVSATLFQEPQTHAYFRLQRASADGFYVRSVPRP